MYKKAWFTCKVRCFANLNLLVFCCSRCRRLSSQFSCRHEKLSSIVWNACSHCTKEWHTEPYPICDDPLSRSVPHCFTPILYRSCTEITVLACVERIYPTWLLCLVQELSAGKLSSIVWTGIALNSHSLFYSLSYPRYWWMRWKESQV